MADSITNQNNKNLSILIILTLLIIIWFLSNSTVFFCAVVLVLTAILINSNFETTDNLITTSSSSQTHTILPSMNNNDDNSTAIAMEEYGCEATSNIREEIDDEHVSKQNAVQDTSSNFDSRISKKDMEELQKSLAEDETGAILFSVNTTDTCQTDEPFATTTVTTCSPPPLQSPVTVLPIKRAPVCITEEPMKIAISYSSAHRERVYKIYEMVQRKLETLECPHPVFIDRDFQHEICRPNGRQYFCTIYKQAHLVVVFLSSSYTKSDHCMAEWEEIFSRFFPVGMNSDPLQLLFIKVDDYDMDKLGLKRSDYPLDATLQKDNEVIAEIITKRSNIVEQILAQK
ncbi:unnamed protein product [Adineta steineri]|uniref:TIR domain-containing protein n=1 Tax=Adineta steineri TaxID=433720 RepID=A0A814K682_9BILA|nr:unnamed protein product [Adineta steineri]CAF1547697.1 unnamed protein product [Adineta steineri]